MRHPVHSSHHRRSLLRIKGDEASRPQRPSVGSSGRATPTETGLEGRLRLALRDSPVGVLLDAAGHSRACLVQVRSGRSLTCRCDPEATPADAAAVAIGLAVHFARLGARHHVPVPRGIVTALADQIHAGNAAADLVWQWLAARGQIRDKDLPPPTLRIVGQDVR